MTLAGWEQGVRFGVAVKAGQIGIHQQRQESATRHFSNPGEHRVQVADHRDGYGRKVEALSLDQRIVAYRRTERPLVSVAINDNALPV